MWLVNTLGFKIHGEIVRVDKSYLIFNDFFELPIHQESEIIVPYEYSAELVQTIRDVVLTNKFPVDYITEVCMYTVIESIIKYNCQPLLLRYVLSKVTIIISVPHMEWNKAHVQSPLPYMVELRLSMNTLTQYTKQPGNLMAAFIGENISQLLSKTSKTGTLIFYNLPS